MVNKPEARTNSAVHEDLRVITDIFTCVDGGVAFALVVANLEDLQNQSTKGDVAANQILEVVHRFRVLCDTLGTLSVRDVR